MRKFVTVLIRVCCRPQSFLILTPSFLSDVFLPCLQLISGFPLKFLKFTSLQLYATWSTSLTLSHLIIWLIQSKITTSVTKAGWDLGCWKDQTERKECLLLAFCGSLKTVYNWNFTCILTEWAYAGNNNDCFDWATELTDSTPHTILL
jgi:hypothetical protein